MSLDVLWYNLCLTITGKKVTHRIDNNKTYEQAAAEKARKAFPGNSRQDQARAMLYRRYLLYLRSCLEGLRRAQFRFMTLVNRLCGNNTLPEPPNIAWVEAAGLFLVKIAFPEGLSEDEQAWAAIYKEYAKAFKSTFDSDTTCQCHGQDIDGDQHPCRAHFNWLTALTAACVLRAVDFGDADQGNMGSFSFVRIENYAYVSYGTRNNLPPIDIFAHSAQPGSEAQAAATIATLVGERLGQGNAEAPSEEDLKELEQNRKMLDKAVIAEQGRLTQAEEDHERVTELLASERGRAEAAAATQAAVEGLQARVRAFEVTQGAPSISELHARLQAAEVEAAKLRAELAARAGHTATATPPPSAGGHEVVIGDRTDVTTAMVRRRFDGAERGATAEDSDWVDVPVTLGGEGGGTTHPAGPFIPRRSSIGSAFAPPSQAGDDTDAARGTRTRPGERWQ